MEGEASMWSVVKFNLDVLRDQIRLFLGLGVYSFVVDSELCQFLEVRKVQILVEKDGIIVLDMLHVYKILDLVEVLSDIDAIFIDKRGHWSRLLIF